jgi:hypothetical protein
MPLLLPALLAAALASPAIAPDDPRPYSERVDAALTGARGCQEQLLQIEQRVEVGSKHSGATRSTVRARMADGAWEVLEVLKLELDNDKLVMEGEDGRPFIMPMIGRPRRTDGSAKDRSNSEELLEHLVGQVSTEWVEARPEGGVLLRRIYKERSRGDGPVRRNQLLARFDEDNVLETISVDFDLPARAAPLVRVRDLDLELKLRPDGHLQSQDLRIGVRGMGIPASMRFVVDAADHQPCAVSGGEGERAAG